VEQAWCWMILHISAVTWSGWSAAARVTPEA
jgi:hypothetical protein